jgi:hypothetical protein
MVSIAVAPAMLPPQEQPPSAELAKPDSDIAVVETATAESTAEMTLVGPDRATVPLTATAGQVTIGPLLETGLWTVRPATPTTAATESSPVEKVEDADDARVVRLACNLVAAAESDLRPRGELAGVEGRALLSLGGQSMWFYLTLLAVCLVATEWWLYQRRIVG